jgi:hypothetical protein
MLLIFKNSNKQDIHFELSHYYADYNLGFLYKATDKTGTLINTSGITGRVFHQSG